MSSIFCTFHQLLRTGFKCKDWVKYKKSPKDLELKYQSIQYPYSKQGTLQSFLLSHLIPIMCLITDHNQLLFAVSSITQVHPFLAVLASSFIPQYCG